MTWTKELVGMLVGAMAWYAFVVLAIAIAAFGVYAIVRHLFGAYGWEDRSYLTGGIAFVFAGLALAIFLWYLMLPKCQGVCPRADGSVAIPTPIQSVIPDEPF